MNLSIYFHFGKRSVCLIFGGHVDFDLSRLIFSGRPVRLVTVSSVCALNFIMHVIKEVDLLYIVCVFRIKTLLCSTSLIL